jgi:CRISPR-associated protein Cas1
MLKMRKLLNSLYITSPESYLSLDGENIVIVDNKKEIARIPLHNIESINSFGYRGVSPALMGKCVKLGINLNFLTPNGKFLSRIEGPVKGNVLLRTEQYIKSINEDECIRISRNMILGKVYNSRWILERATRDHPMQVNVDRLKRTSLQLKESLIRIKESKNLDELRGFEGESASLYFRDFNELILQQKADFNFDRRNRRPPLDNVNAMLSFSYSLLMNMVTGALESVGLDPYVGFMHTKRPGRVSLSLDLMEELRHVFADRFVLSLINKKIVNKKGFIKKEDGAVLMNDDTRKIILTEWQNRKKEVIQHPYLKEKVEWGIVPFVQASLLARYLRGDLDEYPPFFWK